MIISGKEVSDRIKDEVKEEVTGLLQQNKRVPKLAVILVGHDPASVTYVRNKEKACQYVGMESVIINKEEDITQDELISIIEELNHDESVDGILVQVPLPSHIDEQAVEEVIDPAKDVDGFHPLNVGHLFMEQNTFVPCTPKGIIELLDSIHYDLDGKEVVIVGKSNIVGKPLALLCLQREATVTVCHSHTKNLKELCRRGDVLIAAIGEAKFFTRDYVKEGAVVIDVGINRNENNKLCGDVDFDDVKDKVSYITPVPGGVGPMTIAMLMSNTLDAYKGREGL